MIGIDSNILIDILRNRESAKKLEAMPEEEYCTSEKVVYDLIYGIFASQKHHELQLKQFEAILDTFAFVFPINRRASFRAGAIGGKLSKEGKTIDHRDALIAEA